METGVNYPVYGGNKARNRYSPLEQINRDNVKNLEVAWMYNAASDIEDEDKSSGWTRQIQCQPIVVDGVLYGTTPELKLFALNTSAGEQLWKYDPLNDVVNVNRGVVYWENKDDKRILYTVGSNLYAIRAINGEPVYDFGKNGIVDLHKGLSTNLEN